MARRKGCRRSIFRTGSLAVFLAIVSVGGRATLAQDQRFTLSIEECSGEIRGPAGVDFHRTVPIVLSEENPEGVGVQGWSLGLTADGLVIEEVTERGTEAEGADFYQGNSTTCDGMGPDSGYTLGVVLSFPGTETLDTSMPATIGDIVLTGKYPAPGESVTASLAFADGCGVPPVPLSVLHDGVTRTPNTIGCTIEIHGERRDNDFKRGDANADDTVDIADSMQILFNLFKGPGVAPVDCEDAADANDDGQISMSDATEIITRLFLEGPAPGLNCGSDPTDDGLSCGRSLCSQTTPEVIPEQLVLSVDTFTGMGECGSLHAVEENPDGASLLWQNVNYVGNDVLDINENVVCAKAVGTTVIAATVGEEGIGTVDVMVVKQEPSVLFAPLQEGTATGFASDDAQAWVLTTEPNQVYTFHMSQGQPVLKDTTELAAEDDHLDIATTPAWVLITTADSIIYMDGETLAERCRIDKPGDGGAISVGREHAAVAGGEDPDGNAVVHIFSSQPPCSEPTNTITMGEGSADIVAWNPSEDHLGVCINSDIGYRIDVLDSRDPINELNPLGTIDLPADQQVQGCDWIGAEELAAVTDTTFWLWNTTDPTNIEILVETPLSEAGEVSSYAADPTIGTFGWAQSDPDTGAWSFWGFKEGNTPPISEVAELSDIQARITASDWLWIGGGGSGQYGALVLDENSLNWVGTANYDCAGLEDTQEEFGFTTLEDIFINGEQCVLGGTTLLPADLAADVVVTTVDDLVFEWVEFKIDDETVERDTTPPYSTCLPAGAAGETMTLNIFAQSCSTTDEAVESFSCTVAYQQPPPPPCNPLEDFTNPEIICPMDRVINPSSTNINFGNPVVLDNCSPVQGLAVEGDALPELGDEETIFMRTWTVTDENGNSASCTQEITAIPGVRSSSEDGFHSVGVGLRTTDLEQELCIQVNAEASNVAPGEVLNEELVCGFGEISSTLVEGVVGSCAASLEPYVVEYTQSIGGNETVRRNEYYIVNNDRPPTINVEIPAEPVAPDGRLVFRVSFTDLDITECQDDALQVSGEFTSIAGRDDQIVIQRESLASTTATAFVDTTGFPDGNQQARITVTDTEGRTATAFYNFTVGVVGPATDVSFATLTHEFGDVPVNSTKPFDTTLLNNGLQAVEITSADVVNNGNFTVNISDLPTTIPAGGSHPVTFICSPKEAGPHTGIGRAHANDDVIAEISLQCNGIE